MAGIDDVLERLVNDPEFRAQLHEDAATALEGYDLDASDFELLAAQVTEGMGEGGSVEQRTSKSAMSSLLGSIAEVGFNPQPEPPGAEFMGTAPDTLTPAETPSPTDALGRAGFNPQPEPPGHPGATLQEMGFNPQPEPPAEAETVHAFHKANGSDMQDPGDTLQEMGFNPQPEPPGEDVDIDGLSLQQIQEVSGLNPASADAPSEASSPADALGRAGFNPQPEPPGHPGDTLQEMGFNPQPEPPGQDEGIVVSTPTEEPTEVSLTPEWTNFNDSDPGQADQPPPESDLPEGGSRQGSA